MHERTHTSDCNYQQEGRQGEGLRADCNDHTWKSAHNEYAAGIPGRNVPAYNIKMFEIACVECGL